MHRLLLILVVFLSFTAAGFSAQPVGRAAWVMRFDGDWFVAKGMPEKAMLISLQGLANRAAPQLYIVHPKDFQWEIT
jgi:hypothetical protein